MSDIRSSKSKISRIALILVVATILFTVPLRGAVASNGSSKNFAELVWGDNALWSMLAPPSPIPHPGSTQGQEKFYEEAPQAPSVGFPVSPQQDACDHLGIIPGTNTTPCFHDHTIPVPPHNQAGFGALWHVFLVVCAGNSPSSSSGTSSCSAVAVSGTSFAGLPGTLNLASSVVVSGIPTPLTSVSAILAAETAGVVTTLDTGITFICPVQPFSG